MLWSLRDLELSVCLVEKKEKKNIKVKRYKFFELKDKSVDFLTKFYCSKDVHDYLIVALCNQF